MSALTDRSDACNALYAAGHHLLERERIEDAASLFRTMLLADAEDERGWLALGTCHEMLSQDEMAEQLYSAGAQIARKKVRLLVAITRLFERIGDDRADDTLQAAIDRAALDDEEELVELERTRRAS
jgi:hypothetical protein